jgi:hypothetical protein
MNNFPDYIFKKKYDAHFIQTEYDIIFNVKFAQRIFELSRNLNSENIIIQIDTVQDDNFKYLKKLIYKSVDDFMSFYDKNAKSNSSEFLICMMDFSISDESNSWEIFVSAENELSILGCSDSILKMFREIVAPYNEESLLKKLKIIGDRFQDINDSVNFTNKLVNNYKLFESEFE